MQTVSTTVDPAPIDAALVQAADEFVGSILAPAAEEIERGGGVPDLVWNALAERGFLDLVVPGEYGGRGATMSTSATIVSALSRVSPTIGNIVGVAGTTQLPYLLAGSAEQKARVFARLKQSRGVACASFTERGAGSDLGGMRTTATPVPGGYRLRGTKIYALHGGIAEIYCIWARAPRGITAFFMDRATEGLTIGEDQARMGLHGVTVVELFLDDVFVPDRDVLGGEGAGLSFGLQTINKGRLDVGAQCVGIARAAFEYVAGYLEQREQFGQPVIEFQAVQMRLADMSARLEAAELSVTRAAAALDASDRRAVRYCAEVKVFCSEMAVSVTSDALLLMGGYGYLKEHPLERLARDAVVFRLLDGTNDVNRLRITAELRRELRARKAGVA